MKARGSEGMGKSPYHTRSGSSGAGWWRRGASRHSELQAEQGISSEVAVSFHGTRCRFSH
ncbi:hypothetical protein GQ55_8G061200 [Panicum hallii var. hallii]|uniref:Uncharacterized protein n=1 Tax=Panicum hallii var. hallii TaxID=1504633 RepID=A0A2T7CLF4_9POAL|nr:hypothetical protein GQ55_8G061200 [Panicum hallii var. hallii]